RAAAEAGYPLSRDVNGEQQEGFGRIDRTTRNGRRWSAARAYLRPALSRPGLTVRTNALVQRIVFEKGRAIGIEYSTGGVAATAYADAEVIIASGAINSPKILQLSGLGSADELIRL